MDEPFIFKILKKENLFLLISVVVFISAFTQTIVNVNVAVDHFLVGLIFLIGSFAVRSAKETDEEVRRFQRKRPIEY
ncbi:MAG: hypothetical protein ABIH52_02185 [Candidatus Aenigmatarchaeota archaeon]|nr:hypothetical protein [Nanoarchaeota archaeon]